MKAEGCEINELKPSGMHSIVEVYTSQEDYSEKGVPLL